MVGKCLVFLLSFEFDEAFEDEFDGIGDGDGYPEVVLFVSFFELEEGISGGFHNIFLFVS